MEGGRLPTASVKEEQGFAASICGATDEAEWSGGCRSTAGAVKARDDGPRRARSAVSSPPPAPPRVRPTRGRPELARVAAKELARSGEEQRLPLRSAERRGAVTEDDLARQPVPISSSRRPASFSYPTAGGPDPRSGGERRGSVASLASGLRWGEARPSPLRRGAPTAGYRAAEVASSSHQPPLLPSSPVRHLLPYFLSLADRWLGKSGEARARATVADTARSGKTLDVASGGTNVTVTCRLAIPAAGVKTLYSLGKTLGWRLPRGVTFPVRTA
ncbi:unnamed protein product [Urochloa humidicola]